MPLDTKIGEIIYDGNPLELLVSDKKRLSSSMIKTGSHGVRSVVETSGAKRDGQLPIVEMMATRGGMETLVRSALSTLRCEYIN